MMHVRTAVNIASKIDFAGLTTCHGLGRQTANSVMSISSLQKKAAGETLFSEGDEADCIYEVTIGTLRLHKLLPDGRRQITGFLSSGHLLGLSPEGSRVYTAEAVTDVILCRYPRAALDRLIDEQPGFARRLLTITSHELGAAQDQILLLGRKTAMEKVASFLLLLAKQQGGEGQADFVDVPMGRNDIADYLGLTIETVSRALTKLRQDGLIALPTAAHIELCDRDQLQELAAGKMDASTSKG